MHHGALLGEAIKVGGILVYGEGGGLVDGWMGDWVGG